MTAIKYVLQLCHDYSFPFLDVARQYASLFKGTDYKVITVYLIGKKDLEVIRQTDSDEVLFLEYPPKSLKGLKRQPIRQIKQLCTDYHFSFAIAHRYQATFILRNIKHLPVIGVNHSFGKFKRFSRRWFVNSHKKDLYLLGVSDAIRDEMRDSLPRFPQAQIQTLYNRINIAQVCVQQQGKEAARKHLGLSQDSYVFANVGRLHPDKDQKTLINAFAKVAMKLPEALLFIVGQGRLENDLKQQVKQLNLQDKVVFAGVVPDAVRYFRAFDVFVLSSDHEPFGMVLLESIAAEVPVIATNAGGAREIVSDSQWLFDIANEQQLAQLMLTMYALNIEQRQMINQQNRQYLDAHFTDEAVKKTFWQLPFIKRITEA